MIGSFVFCFGDDSHRRDARYSHHREDRRDAETAHCVCTILFYLNSNSNKIYHSISQQIDKSGDGSTSHPWIKVMRAAVHHVPKGCLVHGFCMLDHSSPRSSTCCCYLISKTKQNPILHLSVTEFQLQLSKLTSCCRPTHIKDAILSRSTHEIRTTCTSLKLVDMRILLPLVTIPVSLERTQSVKLQTRQLLA